MKKCKTKRCVSSLNCNIMMQMNMDNCVIQNLTVNYSLNTTNNMILLSAVNPLDTSMEFDITTENLATGSKIKLGPGEPVQWNMITDLQGNIAIGDTRTPYFWTLPQDASSNKLTMMPLGATGNNLQFFKTIQHPTGNPIENVELVTLYKQDMSLLVKSENSPPENGTFLLANGAAEKGFEIYFAIFIES